MAGCLLTFLHLLVVCVVWGAWLHCIKGDCGEIRRIKFYPPDNGRYLEGHVFLNLSIGIHRQCEEKCLLESECVSVNIGPSSNDKFVCELSNSDHVQHPQDLKLRRDWIYRAIENLCVSNLCLNNGKCLMGFTNKKYMCVCKIGFTGENCENGPECTSYTVDKQADRSVTHAGGGKCDSALATAWYRFNGTAGSKMPTSCVPSFKCNTYATGWLNGTHPSPQDGVVNRRVCFSWNGDCCMWQVPIKVKNCGLFYVYKLTKRLHCYLRYCVTK